MTGQQPKLDNLKLVSLMSNFPFCLVQNGGASPQPISVSFAFTFACPKNPFLFFYSSCIVLNVFLKNITNFLSKKQKNVVF